nr:Oxysterol-binding protein- protein 3 [Polyrhizophydium stewartii]
MQEVTIKPRAVFKHLVTVDQPVKELCWNFCTRRKNISFGLFRLVQHASHPRPATLTIASGSPLDVGRAVVATGPSGHNHQHHSSQHALPATQSPPLSDAARRRISTISVSSFFPHSSSSGGITAAAVAAAGASAAGPPHAANSLGLAGTADPAAGPGGFYLGSAGSAGELSSPPTPPSLHHGARDGSSSSLQSFEGGPSGTNKRSQRPRLEDPELEEIIQIAHYESSKVTIKGSFFIQEPGTYVLVFDNRFSLNTSKKLFFFVALKDVEATALVVKKEVEGWMLKKGNRAMQGFQRRWVEVDSTGMLTYFKSPGKCSTYHFKVETAQEFERWTSCIEKFALSRSMQLNETNPYGENILAQSTSSSLAQQVQVAVGQMDPELENVQAQVEAMVTTLKRELGRMKEIIDTSKGRIDSRSQWKDFTLILGSISDVTAGLVNNASATETQLQALHGRIRVQRERAVGALQQAEAAFYACLNDNNRVRKRFGLESVSLATFMPNGGPFMSDDRERMGSMASTYRDEVYFDAEEGDDSDEESDLEESMHEAEENISVIEEDESEPAGSRLDLSAAAAQQPQAVPTAAAAATAPRAAPSAAAAVPKAQPESQPESQPAEATEKPAGNAMTEVPPPEYSAVADGSASSSAAPQPPPQQQLKIVRRTKLPAPTYSMQNISIMSILRNNASVGKDLSTVSMPIALNEPINLLQKLCEELEYSDLLEAAAKSADPVERLCFIAGFVVSGYSSTVYRAARKPFNPLLGETFEFIRDDKGFRFISEKVSHHPPVMACYAESPSYRFYQDSLLKTKFWGKSMELNNTGTVHLEFPALGEHYVWNKVTTSMRNLFAPSRYLEHHGTMKITSLTTGHYCELTFKESGYFTSANNEVAGTVFSARGQKLMNLTGRWDHSISRFVDAAPNNLQVIWRASPFPSDYADNYGFTQFAVELNELTPDLVGMLPNTDVRFRPDQRMYEEGRADEAEAEKQRLEQKQREFRKSMEAAKQKYTPQWFELRPDKYSEGGMSWQYRGGYFESRGKFVNKLDLFS